MARGKEDSEMSSWRGREGRKGKGREGRKGGEREGKGKKEDGKVTKRKKGWEEGKGGKRGRFNECLWRN